MKCNIEFLVVTYFVSLFVDWCLQSNWQASNKSRWGKDDNKATSFWALVTHSIVYGFGTMIISDIFINGLTRPYDSMWLMATVILVISHIIIDNRILVKYIMKWKGMTDDQINDTTNYGFMHIGIDHRLHEMVLLVLSMFM